MAPSLQISIPQTSTSPDPKPHTVYHITLTLPLRTHTIQKRYSDFTTLNTSLQSETGAAPPAALPPKSWLRSTISSTDLTAQRREGLESYLRAILSSPDPRWRQAPSWRSFLALPSSLTQPSSTNSDWDAPSSKRRGSETLDPQAWLAQHRDVKTRIHEARLALRRREEAPTAQGQHAASAEAKAALVKAATGIARCEGALQSSTTNGGEWSGKEKLGDGEVRRRRDLLVSARKEVEGLETQMRAFVLKSTAGGEGTTGAVASTGDKAGLWAGTSTGDAVSRGARPGRVLGRGAKETDKTRELDNSGVLQLQKQVMQEQEQDVLEIGKTVSRLKEMGILINEELGVQNEMLGLVEGDVDRLQGKLDVGKKRMAKIH